MEAVTNAFLGVAAIFAMLAAYLAIAVLNKRNLQKASN